MTSMFVYQKLTPAQHPQDIRLYLRNPTGRVIPMPKLRLVGVVTEWRP